MLLSTRTFANTLKNSPRYLHCRHGSSLCENNVKEKGRESKARRSRQQKSLARSIPQHDLAHNTFFSLHRPLLGLSNERPFFSSLSLEEEKNEEVNIKLSQHMAKLEHFVAPGKECGGQPNTAKIQAQEIMHSTLPVFRMPESADVLDFLSAIETKMNMEDEKEKMRLKELL
ncbi:hypothetical protein BY458DRAFT_489278 [Sporodiniella umbellata]|nr:hypothetical protein BY458DRAFT_489278 [Sporodiniella umbellata]